MLDALTSVAREEGVRGLYAGVSMGLLSVSHGSLQFVAYEHMKRYFQTRPDEKLVRKWLYLSAWHNASGQGKRNFNGNCHNYK